MHTNEFRRNVFSFSRRLFPMVSRLLGNTANAEDAIQEIMMKLWEKRDQLSDHPNLTGFVFLTARNHCLDILRKKKVNIKDIDGSLEVIHAHHHPEQLEWKELDSIIKNILYDLPQPQKEALLMRALDGCEYHEIAAAMELNIPHIRVLISRARKEVSTRLEKIYSYEQ